MDGEFRGGVRRGVSRFNDTMWRHGIDLFRCESILLKSHWVLVIMDQFTRRIIGFGVHAGDVNGVVICRLFNTSISTQNIPHYLSADNDPIFRYNRWQANLRILGIDEIKSIEDRQDLLGHKSGCITTHYSAVELQNLIDAANRVCKEGSRKSPVMVLLRSA